MKIVKNRKKEKGKRKKEKGDRKREKGKRKVFRSQRCKFSIGHWSSVIRKKE